MNPQRKYHIESSDYDEYLWLWWIGWVIVMEVLTEDVFYSYEVPEIDMRPSFHNYLADMSFNSDLWRLFLLFVSGSFFFGSKET